MKVFPTTLSILPSLQTRYKQYLTKLINNVGDANKGRAIINLNGGTVLYIYIYKIKLA